MYVYVYVYVYVYMYICIYIIYIYIYIYIHIHLYDQINEDMLTWTIFSPLQKQHSCNTRGRKNNTNYQNIT